MATNELDSGKIELAKRINNAMMSYQLGVTYQTAAKNYAGDDDPDPNFVEACWKLYRSELEGVWEMLQAAGGKQPDPSPAGQPEQSTAEHLKAMLRSFIQAVQRHQHVHYGASFTSDPKFPGIFVAFVSGSDEMADRLKAKFDEIVPAEFREQGARKLRLQ